MKYFRLKDIDVRRVDLVDRGANQESYIVLAKADRSMGATKAGMKPKPKETAKPKESKVTSPSGSRSSIKVQGDLASKMRDFLANQSDPRPKASTDGPALPDKPEQTTPLARPKGAGSRIVRIAPNDFEVTRADGNIMEWAIPPDKLPEGVEEAIVTMVQSGETVAFQWLIDPLAGPPVEGSASTAAEAFVAMRGALTTQGAMDPMAMLGGFPSQMPGNPMQKPGAQSNPAMQAGAQAKPQPKKQPMQKRTPAIYAAARREKRRRQRKNQVSAKPMSKSDPTNTVDGILDIIVKGLIQVDVFRESTTGSDLRDILPPNLLEELQQVSADKSAE